jgi:hypothetical protein
VTPNTRFTELLQDIEPSTTTVVYAVAAHTAMRDFLCDHEVFGSCHVKTFLSGSYRRNTAIRPRVFNGVQARPDVDIIVVTNHTLDDDPKGVVDQLFEVIQDGYDDVREQTRSVGVTTTYVDMDVVPIIEPYGEGRGLYIADRELLRWLPTNPPEHITWTTRLNAAAGGRFKPLVKLMKWWRRQNPTTGRHPKGFIIECIAAECMDYSETHYGVLFATTLEGVVSRYALHMALGIVPSVADPGVTGNSVTSNVSYEDFRSFYDLARIHAAKARQALVEEDVDQMTALWREIFGPRFPTTARGVKTDGLLTAPVWGSVPPLVFPNRPVQPNKPAGFA